MKTTLRSVLAALLLPLLSSGAAEKRAALQVEIPVHFNDKGKRTLIISGKEPYFDVVLTNRSTRGLRIWRPFCSMGHGCLSLFVTKGDKTWRVEREARGWDANGPMPFTLAPNEHYIFRVKLDDPTWSTDWLPPVDAWDEVYTVQAIYRIPDDEYAREHGIWTGEARSISKKIEIYRSDSKK